ncbi:hypothetical protein SAMN06265378_11653 [Paracoccus sediminis]|uniref:Uncharacterized protein n=1 Tax=Paracoccus sediminis TaxID=1214787 RepID=A0A238YBQ6_9RHOB|nr:hypothetical protein SAMN06265378_11653 [Paracoccus sediminis]
MIVTAPDELRAVFDCYDSMAEAIEFAVAVSWAETALGRLRVTH